MTRINDFEFSIAMKIAANRCLADDVKNFLALNTENTVVDPNVEKRVLRKIKFDEWKNVRRMSAKVLKYALVVLVSAVSLFFAVTMSIQPVRAAFFNAIVTWYEDYIDIRYGSNGGEEEITEKEFVIKKPTYLPDGWIITHEDSRKSLYLCDITNSDNGHILFTQSKDFESGTGIDNDVYEQDVIMLKDDTVEANLFILEDGEYVLVWKDEYLFKLEAEHVDMFELIMIAENIE